MEELEFVIKLIDLILKIVGLTSKSKKKKTKLTKKGSGCDLTRGRF